MQPLAYSSESATFPPVPWLILRLLTYENAPPPPPPGSRAKRDMGTFNEADLFNSIRRRCSSTLDLLMSSRRKATSSARMGIVLDCLRHAAPTASVEDRGIITPSTGSRPDASQVLRSPRTGLLGPITIYPPLPYGVVSLQPRTSASNCSALVAVPVVLNGNLDTREPNPRGLSWNCLES